MAETFKSIFRQRQCEKLYRFKDNSYLYIKGIEYCLNTDNIISDKQLTVHDIEAPLLEEGEHFFLHDIEKEIVIKSRMRSSDGTVVYYVNDEIVETENTKRTYEECEQKILRFKEM